MNSLAPIRSGSFPQTYLEARNALARCEQIDECKDFADKAAAIEVYARQSRDDSLVIMAQRIQARAIRRCGELLQEIPSLKGVRLPEKVALTRTAVARRYGIDEHQQATALRMAAIPQKAFEREVERERPPTITKLAALGVKRRGGKTRGAANHYSPRVHRNCPTCTCGEDHD